MTQFTTNDLAFAGYSQTIIENETSIYVDKTDELEVIRFCNQFLEKYNVPKTKASFQKVEFLLQHDFVEYQAHREELQDWIATNWIKI